MTIKDQKLIDKCWEFFHTFVTTTDIKDCYTAHLKTYLEFRDERNLPETTAVYEYFKELNKSNYKAGTINMKRAAIKKRMRMSIDKMPLEKAYLFDVVVKRLDKDLETKAVKINTFTISTNKRLTDAEYTKVLSKCRSKKQELFIRFLCGTGCRISELTGIKLADCKDEGKEVDIRLIGKGKKERHIQISSDLYNSITDTFQGLTYLFETSGRKKYYPNYISDQIAKITLYAIGRKMSAHKMRHTFVTKMIAQTKKITAISQYIGNSSVGATLSVYNQEELTRGEKRLDRM